MDTSQHQIPAAQTDETMIGSEAIRDYLDMILFQPEEITPEVLTTLELNGVFLGEGKFCIALYHILQPGDFRDGPAAAQEHSRRWYSLRLEEIVRKEIEYSCIHCVFHLGDIVICIGCFPRFTGSDENILNVMCGAAERTQKEFQTRYGNLITTAVSSVASEAGSISELFLRAMELLDFYQFVEKTPPMLLTDNDVSRDTGTDLDAAVFHTFARQIRWAVQAGDRDQLCFTHKNAMEYITATGPASRFQVFSRTGSYLSMVLQQLLDVNLIEEPKELDIASHIAGQKHLAELSKDTEQLLLNLCRKNERSEDDRIVDIREFIDAHISDAALSAQMIAKNFGMSQAALSLCFKRSCMQNISDYIQIRRLALAQRYIRETQLPFETIYEVSGYGSITSMYRAFKKYLGTTPGQYREDAAAKGHK